MPPTSNIINTWADTNISINDSQSGFHQLGTTHEPPDQWSFGNFKSNTSNSSQSLKLEFEPPFRIKLNEEKVEKEKQSLPDLQLGLNYQNADRCKETQEINTKLSLS
ncbi:uncharacterized protein LOC114727294 [Neltuma alba]|nr:uncharacterized protein LOC114727294 [Prosopis alba]